MRPRIGWALCVCLTVTLYWVARVAWPGRQIWLPTTDLFVYFYPSYAAAYRWMAAAEPPLWNPYLLCGVPWFATLQIGFLYPTHVLYMLAPPYVGLAASALLHLVLIALSMWGLVRRFGTTAAAAALGAFLFTMRGSIRHWVLWPNLLEAAAWLPLGSIAVLSLARRPDGLAMAALAAATAVSLLAGYPQVTTILVYGWTALLLALLIARGASPGRWLSAAAAMVGALVLGTLLAAVQLAPALELASVGVRQLHDLTPHEMYTVGASLPRRYDSRLLTPGTQFSFGVIGMALLPAALLGRSHRRLVLGMLAVGLIAFALAQGPMTPLFDVLYLNLPGLAWFRNPERVLLLSDFCFAVIAAVGFDVVIGARAAAAGVSETGFPDSPSTRGAMLAIATVAVVGIFTSDLSAPAPRLLRTLLPILAVAVLLFASIRRASLRRTRAVAFGLLGVGILELFAAPIWPPLALPYTPAAEVLLRRHAELLRALAAAAGTQRVWLYGGGLPPLELAPTLATLMELRGVDGYVPTNLRRQAEYFTYFTEGSTRYSRRPWLFQGRIESLSPPMHVAPPLARRRLIDLAAVRFIVIPPSVTRQPGVTEFVTTAGLEPRSFGPELRVWENRTALPRAFTVYRAREAPPPEVLLERMSRDHFDPLVESYVEGEPLPGADPRTPSRGEAATIVRDESALVEVEADLAAPGLVVLADSFYPGWSATVDGMPQPILATNHLFRGVRVAAGRHRVSFRYRPTSVLLGAAGTLVGGIAVVILMIGFRRRSGANDRVSTTILGLEDERYRELGSEQVIH